MLSNAYEKERLIDQIPTSLKLPKQPKKSTDAVRKEVMEGEIEAKEKDCRLLQSKNL